MGLISNIKNRGIQDITNPKKIKNYFDGKKIMKEGIHLKYDEILSYAEQLVYRTVVCAPCIKEGECKDCKCPQPLAAMVYDHECSMEMYAGMMEAEAWAEYKVKNKIEFRI